MKLLGLILFSLLLSSCSHWSVNRESKDGSNNAWITKGSWLFDELYYCVTGQVNGVQKEGPKCYSAEFYKY
jgi:hypothetical protein